MGGKITASQRSVTALSAVPKAVCLSAVGYSLHPKALQKALK
jgi:hypothetical protein